MSRREVEGRGPRAEGRGRVSRHKRQFAFHMAASMNASANSASRTTRREYRAVLVVEACRPPFGTDTTLTGQPGLGSACPRIG
jgi:hypothetical protein